MISDLTPAPAHKCKITPCTRGNAYLYDACRVCLDQLPEPLQRALKRPYNNDRASEWTRHGRAIADAIAYLHLPETSRAAFVVQKSDEGDAWACEITKHKKETND